MARRTTCPRRGVGAVIVKEKHVLTTGYNGAPKGFPHPLETGCIRDRLNIPSGELADVCPCLHAEQNAILQAALFGVSVKDSTLYCTTQPCTQCARMIVNAGIRDVVFEIEYRDPLSIGLLTTGGVRLHHWDPKTKRAVPYGKTNTWAEAQDAFAKAYVAKNAPSAEFTPSPPHPGRSPRAT
jgi:dCMP deaminase